MTRKRQRGKKTYHGLKNQGATCYLNSVLQVLYMTKDFREAVKRSNSSQDSHGCIDYHLNSVFNTLTNKMASTQEITNHLGIKKVNEQHDAAECFDKILSCSSSKASEIFQGVLTHKNTCTKCGEETKSDSPFWSLPLTVSEIQCYPVTDAVQKYFQESKICGENQLYCNTCNDKTDSSIKLEMDRHPDVLTLLLKRFKFDYNNMDYVKIKCSVQIPYTLEIPITKNKSQHYQLYAYVEHSGELRSGHYTAEIKSEEDDKWYTFNDSTVTMNRYQRFQLDNEEKIPRAYLLFYKKSKNPPSHPPCPSMGSGGAGADLQFWVRGGVHPGQVTSLSQTTDLLDADSCGASTPECFKSDVETPQREGGKRAAARIDNTGVEDEIKNRGEIKTKMGVRDKQSIMTGTNDDRFVSMSNKSEVSIDYNLKLRPDIDGQSRDKPQNGSEKTNDVQQNPKTVQNKIKMGTKEAPNDKRRSKIVFDDKLHCKQGKNPEGHCTETGEKHQILSLANTNKGGLNRDVLQEEQHAFDNKHSEIQGTASINNVKHSQHMAKCDSAANKQGKEEKPQNDKSFQARKKSERLFGESEGNHKTVQFDNDTQNNLQGDIQPNMNSVTQEITAKIETNPQNNSKTNDGETSSCTSMQKQKDLLEQQIQSDETFSTGSENIENVSESTNLTEPSTEKITEVSPEVEIQQDGRNQSGTNKNQRRKRRQSANCTTVRFGLVCPKN